MHNKCSKSVYQDIVSGRPQKFRKLAAFTVLLALGSGGPAYAAPTPTCRNLTATITGTNQAETIMGTAARDVIQARHGNDVIYGLEGNDVICGSLGDDFVYGGYGDMVVSPRPPSGNDHLRGGDDKDTLFGEDGNDFVDGGCPCPFRASPVKDTCYGGSGTGDVAQNCEIKTGFP